MERFIKQKDSKYSNRYSEEFKDYVCQDFLMGDSPKKAVERKYNIGNSRLTVWLEKKGYTSKKVKLIPLPPMSTDSFDHKSKKELEKQLLEAKLLAETYRKMIEVAERDLKIRIIKKSGTK